MIIISLQNGSQNLIHEIKPKQMTMKLLYKILGVVILLHLALTESLYAQFTYPFTKSELFDTTFYNQKLIDNYAWLSRPEREKEKLLWAKTQGDFTNNLLDSITGNEKIESLFDKLYAPNPDEIIVKGVQMNDVYFYKTMPDGKRWLIRKSNITKEEEKITPLPFTFYGKKFTAQKLVFAHQKKLVALMMVESGESNPHIRFFDLDAKTFLKDSIGPVMFNDASGVSMAWLPDDSGLIYTQAPLSNSEAEKYYRGQLKLHSIGNEQGKDAPIFGYNVNKEMDIKEYATPYIYSFPHSPYIIARIRAGKGENYAFAIHHSKLKGALTKWIKLKDYKCNHGTFTANGNLLYAIDDAVPNMQLISVNLSTGNPPTIVLKQSEKILAMSTGDPSIAGGKNALYIKYTSPGKQGILKMEYSDTQPADLPMPFEGSIGEFNLLGNDDLLFVTTNWIRDFEYFVVNHNTNKVSAFSTSKSFSANTSNYISEIIYVPSRDGLSIPVSLIYDKNTPIKEKPRPLLIDSYGCFGSSMDPYFNPENFIWLEMGGIYAAAHIRGGSELGAQWHAGGSYPNKMNSINDIVDIAEYFVKNNYTTGKQQVLTGSSCGSLNVGLATLQRPNLFTAGVYIAGIPDLVTNSGTAFARGQNDFGPLDTKDGFLSRLSISAYYKIVQDKSAPAMLVINGANDYIVPLDNAARYVAKLQNIQQSDRPSLFMVDWKNGHATAGNEIEDIIRRWKFLLWQIGHEDFQLK